MILHYLCLAAIAFSNIYTHSLDQPQGLMGLQSNCSVQSSCSPQTAAEEENRNYLQYVYFSMILMRFKDPTKLFSQQESGQQMDSGADFFAAKWKMEEMGLCCLASSVKTESMNGRSRMFPQQKVTRDLQRAMSCPSGRSCPTDSKMRLTFQMEELIQLSTRVI